MDIAKRKTLSIDIETFSSVDISKAGLYKYVQSNDFEILLFAYSFDEEKVNVIDLAQGEQLPQELITALCDKDVIKTAYNAAFEWYCLNKFWKSPVDQWRCTMVKGLYCGYPAGLKAIGDAIGLQEDKKKLLTGKALIRYFCVPCKPTKTNGGRTRNYPKHDLEKWNLFKEYNRQDVVTEIEIKKKLDKTIFPQKEQKLWEIDMMMNTCGVKVDKKLVEGALKIASIRTEQLLTEAQNLSGLSNPNSVAQLKEWLEDETGQEVTSLNKKDVPELIKNTDSEKVKRMLEIRQELSKTSTKKYDAMEIAMGDDNRVRGLLQFYGANRTGRWAGRLVQVQNLPQNHLDMLRICTRIGKKSKFGCNKGNLSVIFQTHFHN